jgi:hypothetical protein
VQGNKGVYNVLPELGNMYSPEAQGAQGTSGFNAYQNIYGKMAGDELAQANLQKSFSPGMLSVAPANNTYKPIGDFNPATTPYAGGRADLPSYLQEDIKSAYGEYQPQAQSSGQVIYLFSMLILVLEVKIKAYKLAQYASKEKNPFSKLLLHQQVQRHLQWLTHLLLLNHQKHQLLHQVLTNL